VNSKHTLFIVFGTLALLFVVQAMASPPGGLTIKRLSKISANSQQIIRELIDPSRPYPAIENDQTRIHLADVVFNSADGAIAAEVQLSATARAYRESILQDEMTTFSNEALIALAEVQACERENTKGCLVINKAMKNTAWYVQTRTVDGVSSVYIANVSRPSMAGTAQALMLERLRSKQREQGAIVFTARDDVAVN
jgi:hypothetical protein